MSSYLEIQIGFATGVIECLGCCIVRHCWNAGAFLRLTVTLHRRGNANHKGVASSSCGDRRRLRVLLSQLSRPSMICWNPRQLWIQNKKLVSNEWGNHHKGRMCQQRKFKKKWDSTSAVGNVLVDAIKCVPLNRLDVLSA